MSEYHIEVIEFGGENTSQKAVDRLAEIGLADDAAKWLDCFADGDMWHMVAALDQATPPRVMCSNIVWVDTTDADALHETVPVRWVERRQSSVIVHHID